MQAAADVQKEVKECKIVKGDIRISRTNVERMATSCKKYVDLCAQRSDIATGKLKEIGEFYHKVIFAATNAEDFFRSAMSAVSTATEILCANNEMVHSLRELMGEVTFPHRLSSDLKKISKNVEHFKAICIARKAISSNYDEVASVASKVATMQAYIEEQIEMTGNGNDVESNDEDNERNGEVHLGEGKI